MSKQFINSNQAEDAFYQAFQQADIEMMMSVWSKEEDIACIHPGGPRLTGAASIRDGWQRIFKYGQELQFEIKNKKILVQADIAIHHVVEVITVKDELQSELMATNIYRQTSDGWHLILHHASPELHSESLPQTEEQKDNHTIH